MIIKQAVSPDITISAPSELLRPSKPTPQLILPARENVVHLVGGECTLSGYEMRVIDIQALTLVSGIQLLANLCDRATLAVVSL